MEKGSKKKRTTNFATNGSSVSKQLPESVHVQKDYGDGTSPLLNKPYSLFSEGEKKRSHALMFKGLKEYKWVKELINIGVPVTIRNKNKATLLSVAVEHQCPFDVIKLLLMTVPSKSVLGLRNEHNLTPLHEAALVNNFKALREMVNVLQDTEPIPEIDSSDREQQIESLCSGHPRPQTGSICYEIINKRNKEGWTALHCAVDHGHIDVLHVLLMAEQCDMTTCNKVGRTAFHIAARRGHLSCLKLLFVAAKCYGLLEYLPKEDKKRWDLACHASAQDNVEVMKWLLKNMPSHADISHSTEKEYTPLLIACEYQKIEVVKMLLDHRQIDELITITTDGKTALHTAAIHNSVDVIKLLLHKGFPIDLDDENGETALHIAYKKGNYETWRLLLDKGANPHKRNKEEKYPEDLENQDMHIPAEIRKRGDKAIKEYITALREGKKKMPRCKLMVLGEAGVGKTNLLNLLTGEKFEPKHEETEGVNIDFVYTSIIKTGNWERSATGGDEECTDAAAASLLNIKSKTNKFETKDAVVFLSDTELEQEFNLLVQKYKKQTVKQNRSHTATSHVSKLQESASNFEKPNVRLTPTSAPVTVQQNLPPAKLPAPIPRPAPSYSTQEEVHEKADHVQKQVSLPPQPKELQESHKTRAFSSNPVTNISNSPGYSNIRILRKALKKTKSPHSQKHSVNSKLKLTSFDFAGQKHYKPMHHCFITSRAVYVVTINARHLLSSENKEQCINSLKFWINSINVYTDAPLILVGTHKGPYLGASGDYLTEEEKAPFGMLTSGEMEEIDKTVKRHFDNKDCFKFEYFEGGKIIALVENSCTSKNDSGASIVQNTLLDIGESLPQNKEDLPISYLFLEAMIYEKRLQFHDQKKLHLIPQAEIKHWAAECHIGDSDEALDLVLKFFHDIGIIINPSNLPTLFLTKEDMKPLQGMVLIEPQWLADVMKVLMNIDRDKGSKGFSSEFKKNENRLALNQLEKNGIADANLVLFPLWEKFHNGSKEVFQQICLLLAAYGLIIPVKSSPAYFIPCKLPTDENLDVVATSSCNKINVKFKDGFVPPFILHHMMFTMYQEIQCDNMKHQFLASQCFMEYVKDCQWWLSQADGSNVIEINLRTKPKVRTILPAINFLDRLLQNIVNKEELHHISYELGIVTECSECSVEQFFTYISYPLKETSGSSDPGKDEFLPLQCTKCLTTIQIKHDTKIIKSKTYKYIKDNSFKDFTQKFEEMKLQDILIDDCRRKIKGEGGNLDNPQKVIRIWFEQNEDDPWEAIYSYLSYHKHTEFIMDKIKFELLGMY